MECTIDVLNSVSSMHNFMDENHIVGIKKDMMLNLHSNLINLPLSVYHIVFISVQLLLCTNLQ